jgi:alkylation response protein AidB-like acyl-CoA dehydrogenase
MSIIVVMKMQSLGLSSSESLTKEQRQMLETAARLAQERHRPHAAEWDELRMPFPVEERRILGELGFLGISLPDRLGGLGLPLLDALLVLEEVAKECRPAAFPIFEANTGPAQAINLLGTEAQRERFLPPVISGEKTIAVAISEPDAGSAATDMTTTTRLDGDHYVVNGTKRWISNGGHAEQYLLYTRLGDAPGSKGIGAIVVDADAPGLSFGVDEKLMGF